MNYSRFLTQLAQNRQPSLIRELTNLLTDASPELVFMAGGLPNPQMFPFQAASITLRDGRAITIHPKLMTDCLQYGPTAGYPPLVKQLKSLTERLHSPPRWSDTELIITSGSQDGLCKALEMMVEPGDFVVTQEPCYTGTLSILNPFKPRYIAVQCDHEGMNPKALKEALSQWKPQEIRDVDKGVPKVLYINPNACNPTGVSVGEERRKEIYNIASEYNLIILEDDPYYFVQFGDIKDFPPSFLSMDTDGRVLRFDSFSKILSSGLRLGYVTGPKTLIERIVLHKQVSILHASSMSQVLISELLNMWGEEGFLKHTEAVQEFYFKQREAMLAAAEKHLSGLCEWAVPTGGMFLWLKVPGVSETWEMILKRALKKNVILVPGKAFMCDSTAPCQYMRAAFSIVTPEKMDKGLMNLAELIREEQVLQKMDYTKFLSTSSLNRKPSGISEMRKYLAKPSPSLVWLASGMPNPQMFPFREAAVTLSDGTVLNISQDAMAMGLQYGPTPGYIPLVQQLKEMTFRNHCPPRWDQSDLLVTVGCQDGLAKAIEMILNPGDCVVVQQPCYSDVLCILAPLTPKFVVVEADENGMCPRSLKAKLEEAKQSGGPFPKVMYMVPNACNPTGTTLDEGRRREIYSIASEYDLLILEDDPYYFLQYDDGEPLSPSFLRLDTDGRVLRFDSFSKIISAGLRVGFVTGPAPLLERMNWHMQASVLCSAGLSQVMVSELLRQWGDEGFKTHIAKLRSFYRSQRDAMLKAAEVHLTGLCEWSVPKGGIFIWFKVPGLRDTTPMLMERAVQKDVVLVPGKDFMVDDSKPCQYMRAAYSCATPEQMSEAMKNLAQLVREELALQQKS